MRINKTNIGLGIIVLLLLYSSIQTHRANSFKQGKKKAESERDVAVDFATKEKKKTLFYVNELNRTVASVEIIKTTLDNAQRLRKSERLSYINQFNKLKKDLRNLDMAGKINIELNSDSVSTSTFFVECIDTLKVWKYYLKDDFNHIEATVIDTPIFKLNVPVSVVKSWQRKRFLGLRIGRKVYEYQATSPNKIVNITWMEFLEFKK